MSGYSIDQFLIAVSECVKARGWPEGIPAEGKRRAGVATEAEMRSLACAMLDSGSDDPEYAAELYTQGEGAVRAATAAMAANRPNP